MINFNYIVKFTCTNEKFLSQWMAASILSESKKLGELNYIFCNDTYLLDLNRKHLNHDTLTDIISFDDSLGNQISGEIYISIDRIKENAKEYNVSFLDELHRVMIHGILHFCGYNDKSKEEKRIMREKEDYYLSLRTF